MSAEYLESLEETIAVATEVIRIVGYSPTATRLLVVVLLPHEYPPRGLWHVVTAWPVGRGWREAYEADDEQA